MSENIAVSNFSFIGEVRPSAPGSAIIATPNLGIQNPSTPAQFDIFNFGRTEDNNDKVNGDRFLVNQLNETAPGIPVPPSGGAAADFFCGPIGGASSWTNRGAYVVAATSQKNKASGIKVMRENDSTTVNCACAGLNNANPTPQPFTGSCTVKIAAAGQSKVKGE